MMIDRNLKYAFMISVLIPFVMWLIFQDMNALALVAGMLWGGLNLYLIASIVENLLVLKRQLAGWLMLLVKFPLLYGIGYLLLNVQAWDLWFLLAGPPIAFLIVSVCVVWRFSARTV